MIKWCIGIFTKRWMILCVYCIWISTLIWRYQITERLVVLFETTQEHCMISATNIRYQRIKETDIVLLSHCVLCFECSLTTVSTVTDYILFSVFYTFSYSLLQCYFWFRLVAVIVHQNLADCSCNHRPTLSIFPQNVNLKWQIWVTGLLK